MKKGLRIVVVIGLLAIVGLLARAVLTPREPEYQGKPLSVWLEGYDWNAGPSYTTIKRDTDEAIRHIGTNAIPALLKMLRLRDSKVKKSLAALIDRQKLARIKVPPSWRDTSKTTFRAMFAFVALGSSASNAVPQV